MENRGATTTRFSCKEQLTNNIPKSGMTKDELIKHLLEYNLTDEAMEAMSKRIQEDNDRWEAEAIEQRMLWHKHKNDVYDI